MENGGWGRDASPEENEERVIYKNLPAKGHPSILKGEETGKGVDKHN
jgi:hypothetical protein